MLDIDVDHCNGIKSAVVFFKTASQIIEIFNGRKLHRGNVANYKLKRNYFLKLLK